MHPIWAAHPRTHLSTEYPPGNFSHNIAVIFEFFICICKITCKPMRNFAENLNLGNRVPAPPAFLDVQNPL